MVTAIHGDGVIDETSRWRWIQAAQITIQCLTVTTLSTWWNEDVAELTTSANLTVTEVVEILTRVDDNEMPTEVILWDLAIELSLLQCALWRLTTPHIWRERADEDRFALLHCQETANRFDVLLSRVSHHAPYYSPNRISVDFFNHNVCWQSGCCRFLIVCSFDPRVHFVER